MAKSNPYSKPCSENIYNSRNYTNIDFWDFPRILEITQTAGIKESNPFNNSHMAGAWLKSISIFLPDDIVDQVKPYSILCSVHRDVLLVLLKSSLSTVDVICFFLYILTGALLVLLTPWLIIKIIKIEVCFPLSIDTRFNIQVSPALISLMYAPLYCLFLAA